MRWQRLPLVSDNNDTEEEAEIRVEQVEDVRALRERRREDGKLAANRFISTTLSGDGPWTFHEVFKAWRAVADVSLVSRKWLGRSPKPLVGFGARWLVDRLHESGFRVDGHVEIQRDAKRLILPNGVPAVDRETGRPIYEYCHFRRIDRRTVTRAK